MKQAPPRILYLNHASELSGGEIALLNLVSTIDRSAFQPVVMLLSNGPLSERLGALGIETHVLPLPAQILNTRKDSLGAKTLLNIPSVASLTWFCCQLAAQIRQLKVAAIHCNSLKADIIGAVIGRTLNIPVLWHIRDRITDRYLPPAAARLFRLLAGYLPDYVITNSASTLQTVQDSRVSTRSVVILDGVRAQDFNHGSGSDRSFQPLKIVLIGRISPWKGQHIFIESAARLQDRLDGRARFQIAGAALFGEQEYEAELHALADRLGVKHNIEFLGFVSDIPKLIDSADIVVHASTLGEPFGQVIAEAMAGGKAVIATNGGGVPEIVTHGKTGILIPMSDPEALADAIAVLVSDGELRRKLGQAARLHAQAHLSIELTAQEQALYTKILTKSAAPDQASPSLKSIGACRCCHNNIVDLGAGQINLAKLIQGEPI